MIQAIYEQLNVSWASTEHTSKTHTLINQIKERLSAVTVEWRVVHTTPALVWVEEEDVCQTLALALTNC